MFWWKASSWKKVLSLFDHDWWIWELSENNFRSILEVIFYVSGRYFAGILFSFGKFSSRAFAEFERTKVGLSGKLSNRVVKSALYIGKKTILKRVYNFGISRLFYICRFWDENFQPVRETLISGVKTTVHVFRGAIWGNMFLEENNLSFFGPYSEVFGLHAENFLAGLVEL